jgi:cellulose synthase/poly-beta-1,6-N-acetylglucosamine synthase-like glycosyltransferase
MANPTPTITAILPARNEEAAIEIAVRSLAAQPEIAEIRAVNDHSTDRTAEILARLAAEVPRLRLLEAPPLPAGWVGKNHAAWFGAQGATTDWLLFTDADVRHLPGSAAHALANAELRGAALVSYSPAQVVETWWERAMIPFVFVRLAARFSYDEVNNPESASAAANGQFLFIRREAYQSVGGHGGIAAEVLEDVALARKAKSAGYRLYFAAGPEIAETRMYRSIAAMWEGWTKNLYPLVGASPLRAADELLRVLPVAELALLALGMFYPFVGLLALFLLAARLLAYSQALAKQRFPRSCIEYWAPGMVLYSAALMVSAWRHSKGTVDWKGRTYPVGS